MALLEDKSINKHTTTIKAGSVFTCDYKGCGKKFEREYATVRSYGKHYCEEHIKTGNGWALRGRRAVPIGTKRERNRFYDN